MLEERGVCGECVVSAWVTIGNAAPGKVSVGREWWGDEGDGEKVSGVMYDEMLVCLVGFR